MAGISEMDREAEQRIFGTTHSVVGAYLLGLWGLALSLVEAVAFQNNPRAGRSDGFCTLTAVHIANALLAAVEPADAARCCAELDEAYIA